GWEDGHNLRLDIHWSSTDLPQIRSDAAAVVSEAPDAIFTISPDVLAAVLAATHAIPTVFIQVPDPVGGGFVASIAHPGGNVTGFSAMDPSMAGKWLQLLKDSDPRLASAGILFNSKTPAHAFYRSSAQVAASALSISLIPIVADDAASIERGIRGLAGKTRCGLLVLPHNVTVANHELIIALAAEQHLPAIYPFRLFADAGGLIYYGIDDNALFRQAAPYLDRILKGEKPGDLPVQAPTTFDLVLNLKTAKSMGFEFPPMLLARANAVIE
ncbi:MAG TPA: ABC transporter substrate-binding protein, partial [Acidisoma sp.]|nr:ABC transporter substrate-binding protein [Acidisoma sp.]